MTKQATLGPIDPSVNTALNPQIPGNPNPNAPRVPVSVEAIKGFIELAKDELSIKNDDNLTKVLLELSDKVHPLVLGEVYRARTQIQMLARKLLTKQVTEVDKIEKIISFLCSDSGSHDYTINRREARDNLGLNIDKPNDEFYTLIKKLYDDISNELQLGIKFDPNSTISNKPTVDYQFTRGLIESVEGGSHAFISEGKLTKVNVNVNGTQQQGINDNRIFDGWRHRNV